MKRSGFVGIGLIACLLGGLATAPASLLDMALARMSDGKLRLVEARGTLWSGAGRMEMRDAAGRTGVARRMAWRVLPASFLSGRIVGEVDLEQAAKPFPVILSINRIEFDNADIVLPAAILGLSVPKLAPLGLSGDMRLHVASLAIERQQMLGHVTVQWRNAGSALTPVSPLGDYELNLEGEGATMNALLHTLRGPLQLDGNGSWENGNAPGFVVVARVPPQYRQQLGPLLGLIAVERGDHSFELQIKLQPTSPPVDYRRP